MISEAFNWWADGLATALLGFYRRMSPPRRFRLSGSAWPYLLTPAEQAWVRKEAPIEIPEAFSAASLSHVRGRTRGSVFEVVVPSAALLERELDALPKASEPYVESVVRHQIEAIFPWSAKDVLHTTLVEHRGDGKIGVTVRATSRSAIEPALLIAAACEAREILLIGSDARDHQRGAATIPVALGQHAHARIERARTMARYAIVALLAVASCVIGWTTFIRWSAANELVALEQAIADRRALLIRASASRHAAEGAGLEEKKRQGPLVVMVLERLSELLPDDTYVTDLSLDGNRLRISGVSRQASDLVLLLERSGHFRNASSYAPTMRIAGTSTDRFSIEAVVVAQLEAKP
jgi:general secretion pathway protein L